MEKAMHNKHLDSPVAGPAEQQHRRASKTSEDPQHQGMRNIGRSARLENWQHRQRSAKVHRVLPVYKQRPLAGLLVTGNPSLMHAVPLYVWQSLFFSSFKPTSECAGSGIAIAHVFIPASMRNCQHVLNPPYPTLITRSQLRYRRCSYFHSHNLHP
eukprot:scaffold126652_cov18-Tisochrysis_lutea.AAC.1